MTPTRNDPSVVGPGDTLGFVWVSHIRASFAWMGARHQSVLGVYPSVRKSTLAAIHLEFFLWAIFLYVEIRRRKSWRSSKVTTCFARRSAASFPSLPL